MKKALYAAAGLICMGIGFLGTVLPVLPATPLFLLALFFFAKGSERLSNWFKSTSIYKKHLQVYVESKSMTMKQKMSVQALVWSMMAASFILINSLHLRILLVVLFFIHNYFIFFRVKTMVAPKENLVNALDEEQA
jgi:uncharacterized membrane protein YbaN (DUF454 family)